jgi:hypothetical protein
VNSDPTRTLDAIDAAVDGRCACGCGDPVGAVSAWFAGPACQQRWHAARADRPMRDGGRMAGIGPGWGSDQAGPEGGVGPLIVEDDEVHPQRRHLARRADVERLVVGDPPPELCVDLARRWRDLVARGELRVPASVHRALPLPPGWRVEFDTTPILAGRPPAVTLTAEQQADAVEVARRLRSAVEDMAQAMVAGLGPVLAEARVTLANGHRALLDLGLIERPPADDRQATLTAVRARRNHGPTPPVRAPRRLDPHGGRRGGRRG